MADLVANRTGREALRGAEVDMIDVIFETLAPKQWAEWLKGPLERAAAKGARGLAHKLVGAGAQIGDALHEAVKGGHGEIVSDLLEGGTSLDTKNKDGDTPLQAAARWGKPEMVHLLLLRGADKDAFEVGKWTPLDLAARHGHLAASLALLAAGADVSLRCGGDQTPVLSVAAEKGHVDILRALIDHGADLDVFDTDRETALHAATRYNKTEAIDVLVEAGANIEARNKIGDTPLLHASLRCRRDAVLCLLKHGAAVNVQANIVGTPLRVAACNAGKPGAAEVVDSLLRAGADETFVDATGKKAADMIGMWTSEEDSQAEDIERVRELLANAPADRAWRRRGYLVLCRAHPDRVQQNHVISGTHHTDTGRSCAKLARAGGIEGDSTADESTSGDWAFVVAKVLRLQEEGIFRTIVGYL